MRSFLELPPNAQRYLANLYAATVVAAFGHENYANAELPALRLIGVGPDSSQVILDAPHPFKLLQLADKEFFAPVL